MNTWSLLFKATIIFIILVCLASGGDIHMDAENTADVSGAGNHISQNIGMNVDTANGMNIWQDADNRANVGGWNNRVSQNIGMNVRSRNIRDISQDADNTANVGGWNNRVSQSINQNAWRAHSGSISQDADNTANVNGWSNSVSQSINQNARSAHAGAIRQEAGNKANADGWNNIVSQNIYQSTNSEDGLEPEKHHHPEYVDHLDGFKLVYYGGLVMPLGYFQVAGGNYLWIESSEGLIQYASIPQGSSISLIAYSSIADRGIVYDMYQPSGILQGSYTEYPYNFYAGYNRLTFGGERIGRHVLSFVVDGQTSSSITIDVIGGYSVASALGNVIGT